MFNSNYKCWDFISILSGALLMFSFAPYEYEYFAVVAMALLFISWQKTTPLRAAMRGLLFGVALFGTGLYWVYISIHDFGGARVVPAIMLTLLFAGFWALFPALAGYLSVKFFANKGQCRQLIGFPTVWLLVEYFRGVWVFNGFPWFQLAYSQLDTPIAGYVPILGCYGGGWLTAFTAALLASLIMLRKRFLTISLTTIAVIWAAGWLLQRVNWTDAIGEPIKVTMIQGNIAQDKKWQPEYRQDILQLYKQMTAGHWDSQLIIWPESAVPAFYHQVRDAYIEPLIQDAKEHAVDLVISMPLKNESGEKFNAVMSFGKFPGVYYKIHLLPFGEYLPLQPLSGFVLDSLTIMPVGSFTAGHKAQKLLQAAGYPFIASICYEDAFGEQAIHGLPEAAYLINVTNDGWFGESVEPYQHMQLARMRALETGRYLLRSTNNGVTAIVAPNGKIIQQAPLFMATSLTGYIKPMSGMTVYARYGDRPVIVAFILLLIFLV